MKQHVLLPCVYSYPIRVLVWNSDLRCLCTNENGYMRFTSMTNAHSEHKVGITLCRIKETGELICTECRQLSFNLTVIKEISFFSIEV